MQGDTAKAKAVYQDFVILWNDADRDIAILGAKAEYAKLQQARGSRTPSFHLGHCSQAVGARQ